MGASRSSLHRPLPPDLRKEMEAELRPLVTKRADRVAVARRARAAGIQTAKDLATADIAEAEAEYDRDRATILVSYEAKAASRRVEASLEAAVG